MDKSELIAEKNIEIMELSRKIDSITQAENLLNNLLLDNTIQYKYCVDIIQSELLTEREKLQQSRLKLLFEVQNLRNN